MSAEWGRASSSPGSRRHSAWCSSRRPPTSSPMLRANPYLGASGTLAFVLGFMTWLLLGSGDLRRRDRHRQHLRDGRRGPHPPHRADAADRRVGAIAAIGDRASGAARRRTRRVPRARRRDGCGGRRGVACGADAGARRRAVRSRQSGPARARRDRDPHDLGRGMGGIATRADGDAAAGARRIGRGLARGGGASHGSQHRGPRAFRRRRRAARARHPRRARHTAGRDHRVRGRHPVVHGPRARRDARHAAGAAARRAGCSGVPLRRDSPPRTRCAIPSGPVAWRSAWSWASRS